MTPAKKFYQHYEADDNLSGLSFALRDFVMTDKPQHVFEFGCGSGKNLKLFHDLGVVTCGMDISFMNVVNARIKHGLPFVIHGNEQHLGHIQHFDVVFTMSVLDHIELINRVVADLKGIARKALYLAETIETPGEYYYKHDYESLGFEKIKDFSWVGEDGATYFIWKWTPEIKQQEID